MKVKGNKYDLLLLENTSSKQRAFNNRTDKLYNWLETIHWEEFGIDSGDGIEHQEIVNLQNAVGADADGLVGLSTYKVFSTHLLVIMIYSESNQWRNLPYR